jgi:pimeloyl-ACP methyl ester carboxylesterase
LIRGLLVGLPQRCLLTAVERWKERALATYALIPGGGGDPWEWHRLVPELASRGQQAIAVWLPAEDDAAGWSEYADAVIDAVGERAGVIIVAASMGGFTAPIVCTRRRVDLLVLLNAMIPMPGETFNAWGSNTGAGPARAEYHASLGLSSVEAQDDAVIYYHDLTPDLRAEAQARTWQNQSMTPLDEPWPLAAWPDVPTRVLASRHDRMFPLDFQRRVARERLGIEAEALDGGHMVALSNPAALADRLEAHRLEAQGEGRDTGR